MRRDKLVSCWWLDNKICEHEGVGFEEVVRRFSSPLLFIVSFIDFLVFRYDNDNYRYRCRYRRFSALIVSKCYLFRYPTLVYM